MPMKLTGAGRAAAAAGLAPGPVVILCRPQIGENVGAAARAMLNFGLAELRLVRPECGWPNAKAVATASGAVAVLNGITVFASLEEATADLHHIFATTARSRELKKPIVSPETAVAEARSAIGAGRRVGLVFGAERTGLENEELLLADAIVRIPTNPAFGSLNLAQAVLLLAYSWSMQDPSAPTEPTAGAAEEPATKGEVEALLRYLLAELEAADFFKSPDSRRSLMAAIKVMFERRGWTRPEVNLMRGILKELIQGNRRRAAAMPAQDR
jgi:tRNA/rRNA methyltransferase